MRTVTVVAGSGRWDRVSLSWQSKGQGFESPQLHRMTCGNASEVSLSLVAFSGISHPPVPPRAPVVITACLRTAYGHSCLIWR